MIIIGIFGNDTIKKVCNMGFSAKEVMHQIASNNNILKKIEDTERKKLQGVLTQMLKDIQQASKRVNVQFALCGGSCLGAVRHQGFIPWDDDVDISMMRKDWELFKCHFKEILGDKYILEAPNYDNKDTKYPWAKIYKKGTVMTDILDLNLPYSKGISIDIFVIENVSNWKITQYFDAIITITMKYIATSMLFYKYPNRLMDQYFCSTVKSTIYYRLRQTLGLLFSFISHKTWCRWYDKFASRHKRESLLTTIPTGINLYIGEMLRRTDWLPYSTAIFEGLEVNVPNNPHKYCAQRYGDNYMEIPPLEKRESHFIVQLSFDK